MSDYTYPAEFIAKAKKRIQAQLDGNGVDPKNITFEVMTQGIGEFTAQTRYTLDCAVETAQVKGKTTKGTQVPQGQLQTEIKKWVTAAQSDQSFDTKAKSIIKKVELGGFGANKLSLPYSGGAVQFCEHYQCNQCGGKGQAQCYACRGQGRTQCPQCYGQGLINCIICRGQGKIQNGDQWVTCTECQGRMQVFCPQCHGQKNIPCTQCQSKGSSNCTACNAQGANTHIATIKPQLIIDGIINVQELDDIPKRMVAKAGAASLAMGGHLDIRETKAPEQKDEERAWYENAPEDTNKHAVFYSAKMPWALMKLTIGKIQDEIGMAGTKGAIADDGKWMDKVIDPVLTLMKRAAMGDGYVAGLLKEASDTARVSRETLSAVITKGPKKAMPIIAATYPLGLSKATIQSFVKDTYLALKRVTRRPRYIGLGIGLAVSTALYYYWFKMGGIALIEPTTKGMAYGLFALPLPLGILINIFCIKGLGWISLRSVTSSLNLPANKLPAMGKAGLYGIAGNVALWLGLMIL